MVAIYNGVGFVKADISRASWYEVFTFEEWFLPFLTKARFLQSSGGINSTNHLCGPARSDHDCLSELPFQNGRQGAPSRQRSRLAETSGYPGLPCVRAGGVASRKSQ